MVSLTNVGIGRNSLAPKHISEKRGVNIVMGTGWYVREYYPSYVRKKLPDELAESWFGRVRRASMRLASAWESSVKWAQGGDSSGQRRSGCCGPWLVPNGEPGWRLHAHDPLRRAALEQLLLFDEEGVYPDRIIIGLLGDRRGADMLLPVARTGAWLEIDNIGWLSYTSDEQRGRNISELAEAGYLHRILLGTDIAPNSQLSHYGGKGYG